MWRQDPLHLLSYHAECLHVCKVWGHLHVHNRNEASDISCYSGCQSGGSDHVEELPSQPLIGFYGDLSEDPDDLEG